MQILEIEHGAAYPKGTALANLYPQPYYEFQMAKTPYCISAGANTVGVDKNQLILWDLSVPCSVFSQGDGFSLSRVRFSVSEKDIRVFNKLRFTFNQPFDACDVPMFSCIFRELTREYKRGEKKNKRVLDLLIKWLLTKGTEIQHSLSDPAAGNPYYGKLKAVRLELQAFPELDWRSAGAAERLNISLSHFQHLYRNIFGKTFTQDVTDFRMQRARDLLAQGKGTIEEIAYSCGYKDIFHFSKQFKIKTGVSPLQYRKRFK